MFGFCIGMVGVSKDASCIPRNTNRFASMHESWLGDKENKVLLLSEKGVIGKKRKRENKDKMIISITIFFMNF